MREFTVGQRVRARFSAEEKREGVVTQDDGGPSVAVQFTPCDAHWHCRREDVSAYGTNDGWTNQEYRIEREKAYGPDRARNVEEERREKYPATAFSMYTDNKGYSGVPGDDNPAL